MLVTCDGFRASYAREEEGELSLWVGLSLHSSDAGGSGGNRGSALLQPRKSTMAAKWHITHFLLLETFQEVGFCSTEVRKLHRIPNRGFEEHSSGGILQPQQPGVLVQRSTSRRNLELRFWHHRHTLFYVGTLALWHWMTRQVHRLTVYPKNKKNASFMIVIPYWKLDRLQEYMYFQDNKMYSFRLHKYTHSYTHTSFALSELQTQIQRKGADQSLESYTN